MQPPLTAEGAIRPNYQGRQKLVFTLLVFYFGLYGIMVGSQGVLWAEIVLALGLSKGAFGNTQLIAPLIAVALLLMGGQLSAWGGKKRLALLGLALLSAAILTLARATS